jgi:hypothetical protein
VDLPSELMGKPEGERKIKREMNNNDPLYAQVATAMMTMTTCCCS